jgi:hypothetical protein
MVSLKAYHDAAKEYRDGYTKVGSKGGIRADRSVDARAINEYCSRVVADCTAIIADILKLP